MRSSQAFDHVAQSRLSVVTARDLRQLGINDHRRESELRQGRLVPVTRGVYRPDGVRLTRAGELRAACAAAGHGAVASHRSALWLWDISDDWGVDEVTVPVGRRCTTKGLIVHRSSDLAEPYCCTRKGVPATTPARTLLDAAAVLTRHQLDQAVEQAIINRLVTVDGLRHILDELGKPGRRGAGKLRSCLDTRALGDARAESQLEPLTARLCRDHGIEGILFQESIVLDGVTYRPDFQIPAARLIIEVDGLDAHRSRDAFMHDLRRQNAFIRHGWLILRYSAADLRRPAAVAREIRDMVRHRTSVSPDFAS